MPYETLDLTGMDIDSVEWGGQILRANYGGGYGDKAVVGPAGGLHRWALSSGCLPDDDDISPIDGESRFNYYWEFFKEHTTGGSDVFLIEFRGKFYHASFVEPNISMERFTEDLFAGGVEIQQRRVAGVTYYADGSVDGTPPLPPSNLVATATGSTTMTVTWDEAVDPEDEIDGGGAESLGESSIDGGDAEG